MSIDLETYRQEHGLTYEALAAQLGLPQIKQAHAYALGERWPRTAQLERILGATGGKVSVDAMHARRVAWLAAHGGRLVEREGVSTRAAE